MAKCQFFNKVFGRYAAFFPKIPCSAVERPGQQLVTTSVCCSDPPGAKQPVPVDNSCKNLYIQDIQRPRKLPGALIRFYPNFYI